MSTSTSHSSDGASATHSFLPLPHTHVRLHAPLHAPTHHCNHIPAHARTHAMSPPPGGSGVLEIKCPNNKGRPEEYDPSKGFAWYYMPQVRGALVTWQPHTSDSGVQGHTTPALAPPPCSIVLPFVIRSLINPLGLLSAHRLPAPLCPTGAGLDGDAGQALGTPLLLEPLQGQQRGAHKEGPSLLGAALAGAVPWSGWGACG